MSLFLSLTCQAQTLPSLPRPLREVQRSGAEYSAHLEGAGILLKEKKIDKFYQEVEFLIKKIDTNWEIRRNQSREIWTKEDVIAWEWLCYYLSTSPMFLDASFQKAELSPGSSIRDISCKQRIFQKIMNEGPTLLEMKAKFLAVDVKKLNEVHVVYLQALVATFRYAQKEWIKLGEKGLDEFREEEKKWKKTVGLDDEVVRREQEKIRYRAQNLWRIRCDRSTMCENILSFDRRHIVGRVIKTYPKDGKRVQEFFLKSGYSKEECRSLFLKSTVRNKSNDYLFIGL